MNIWCFEEARLLEALKEHGNNLLAAGVSAQEAEKFVNEVCTFLRGDVARKHKLIVDQSSRVQL